MGRGRLGGVRGGWVIGGGWRKGQGSGEVRGGRVAGEGEREREGEG